MSPPRSSNPGCSNQLVNACMEVSANLTVLLVADSIWLPGLSESLPLARREGNAAVFKVAISESWLRASYLIARPGK